VRTADAILTTSTKSKTRGTVEATISVPETLEPGVEATYHAAPCCGGHTGSYHWRARSWCRGVPCGDWRDMGDGADLNVRFDEDSELELTVTSPFGDRRADTLRVGVRPPFLAIEGPDRILQHAPGRWSARIAAMGPVTLSC